MTETIERPAYSDDARRMADEVTLHAIAGSKGHWVCFRLSDGKPRGHAAYPTRTEAVMAMRWDRDETVYLQVAPDGMTAKEAEAYLRYARFLHDQGWRLPDPGFDYDAGMPTFAHDKRAYARHLVTGR